MIEYNMKELKAMGNRGVIEMMEEQEQKQKQLLFDSISKQMVYFNTQQNQIESGDQSLYSIKRVDEVQEMREIQKILSQQIQQIQKYEKNQKSRSRNDSQMIESDKEGSVSHRVKSKSGLFNSNGK